MTDVAIEGGRKRRPYKVRTDRKFSDETIRQICEMRERGLSSGIIQRKLACQDVQISHGAIHYYCLVNGADLPVAKRKAFNGTPGQIIPRGNHVVRRFTPEEDVQLRALSLQGLTYVEIAKITGRRHNSVRGRLATLARHDARQEETMQ